MRVKVIVCTLCIFALLGCMTPYQQRKKQGIGQSVGGYTDTALGEKTFRINVSGSSGTHMERVRDIGIVRAAEITLSSGYDYFRILDSWEFSQVGLAMGRVPPYYRSIIIRLTTDPDDIDAQWIIDTIGPEVGYEQ